MDVPIVDALADWSAAAGPSPELLVGHLLGPDVLGAEVNRDDGAVLALFRSGQQAEVPLPPGAVVQEVYPSGDAVVYTVVDEATNEYRILRWDGEDAAAAVLYASVGEDAFWSETAVSGTTLFLTVPKGGVFCIDQMDLTASEPSAHLVELWCQDQTGPPGWLEVRDSTLSFLSNAEGEECAAVHRVVLPGATVEEVDVPGCVSRGVATGDAVLWTEPPADNPEGENWFATDLRALVAGDVVKLGTAVAGSQTVCDGTFYWLTEGDDGWASEIRAWRAGAENVQVIYRSPVGADMTMNYVLSRPTCAGGTVGVQRLGMWANAGEEFLVTPAWDWAADLIPAAPRPT